MVMMRDTEQKKTKQIRISVNFRLNEVDKELHDWIQEKGKVIGVSNAIKQILAEKKNQEESEGK